MRKLFSILLILFSLSLSAQEYIPNASSAQIVTDNFVSSFDYTKALKAKRLIGELERTGLYSKVIALWLLDQWNGSCLNLLAPVDYDGAFKLTVKTGSPTATETGLRLHAGDSLNTHWVNDLSSSAPRTGFFYVTDTIVNTQMVYSRSPFNIEANFGGKAYVSIWNNATGIPVTVEAGFHLAQRLNSDTVEFYQNSERYVEALAIGSQNPTDSNTYIIGNLEASYNLQIAGFTQALTQQETATLRRILNDYLNGTDTYSESSASQNPIWAAIRTSKGAFPNIGVHEGALDDGNITMLADTIHYLGGTDNVSLFAVHYASGDEGKTWITKPTPPWSARNACGIASHDGFIWYWGGNDYVGAFSDSWKYSPATGWVQVSSSMTNWGGRNSFAKCWTGTEYITIGGGVNTVIYSTNLTSWTTRATLPTIMQDVTGATACYSNGAIYWTSGRSTISGTYPGVVMKSTDGGATWTQVASGSQFANKWGNLLGTENGIVYIEGTTGESGGSNLQGTWWSNDGVTWTRFKYELGARHATPVNTSSNGKIGVSAMGNFWNESWIIKRLDK